MYSAMSRTYLDGPLLYIEFNYINISVLQVFLPLRKAIYFHMLKYDIFTGKNISQSEV